MNHEILSQIQKKPWMLEMVRVMEEKEMVTQEMVRMSESCCFRSSILSMSHFVDVIQRPMAV